MKIKDWMPLFSQMVWPVILIVALMIFWPEVSELYGLMRKAVFVEGRSFKAANLFEIGEKVDATKIKAGTSTGLTIEAIKGDYYSAIKGSGEYLERLKEAVHSIPNRRFEVLKIRDGVRYSRFHLGEYIADLGIQYIVFQRQDEFDGWIDSGLFLAQLPQPRTLSGEFRDLGFTYRELQRQLTGIRHQTVHANASAIDVLKMMQSENVENLAVVDENSEFLFMLSREEVIGSLVAALVLLPQ